MKKLFLIIILVVFVFLIFSFTQRPESNKIDPDVSFGFLLANDQENYHNMKELGIDYILMANFSVDEAEKRIDEAKKQGIKVYLSAGVLAPDDFKRMESLGTRKQVEGFFLDEPHLHKNDYSNTDIENWLNWSKEKFPDKKIFIATPRIETYEELLSIPNLHLAGFQPDYYPINGPINMYGSQRKLIQRMTDDGFEVQPIIQTHALNFYESELWRIFIDAVASLGGHGLVSCPTPEQVVAQIENVSSETTKIIWMYPGEDGYVKWTQERKDYIKKVFDEINKNRP